MSENPSIYIPPELLERVDHQAEELGRSRSWFVRHALEQFLDVPTVDPKPTANPKETT